MISKNANGEYALFKQGALIGFAPVKYINSIRVVEKMYDKIIEMQQAAQHDSVHLTLASGLRSWDEQVQIRMQYVIDKTKVHDMGYILNQPSEKFSPRAARPGYSNHQNGQAYDFSVQYYPPGYAWLVKNAHNFGFIRTVQTEVWHWEYIPGADQFCFYS